jgi:hypothetical protein
MMRDFASKIENENPQLNGDIVHIMDKLYVACVSLMVIKIWRLKVKNTTKKLKD